MLALITALAHGESALLEFRSRLAKTIEPEASTLLVRVEFDKFARAKSVCADHKSAMRRWSARRDVSEQVSAILDSPLGPACLAGRRLDFNRYQSKLAEVQLAESQCRSQVRTTAETNGNSGMDMGRVTRREFARCMSFKADWILLYPRESNRVLVFAPPEVSDPLDVRAANTASRCSRTPKDLDLQISCIQEDGWELLAEPLNKAMKTDVD